MENKSKNTSEISQWIDNYLHISLDTEEYVEVRNFLQFGIYLKRNGLNVILEEISAIFRTYI